MFTMKKQLIITVASIGIAAGMGGFACAQDNPSQDTNRPANERMEKGSKAESPQHKMNGAAGEQQGASPERNGQNGDMPRKAQNAEPKAGAGQTGQQPEGSQRSGQNADQEKRKDGARTGQGEPRKGQGPTTGQGERLNGDQTRTGQGEQQKGDQTRTGQGVEPRNVDENRTGQGERDKQESPTAQREHDQNGAQGRTNVRVTGDLHISQEKATRISETLRNRGHRENVDVAVRVGAPLPESARPMPLPPDIVEVAPDYRGYDYIVVNDEIIFVQPTTHVVVGMIDAGGATAEADTGQQIVPARPCPVD
jgi:hypothetical protein